MASLVANNGRIFFVYDHTAQQKEEDDPKDSIIYFYPPSMNVTQQCELCGQLMGVAGLLRNLFSPDEPSIVTLNTEKYSIKHVNIFSLALSSTLQLPDDILTAQLETLYGMFAFYQGSIEKVLSLCSDRVSFLKEMSIIWDSYLPYVRCYDDELAMVFNRIPTVSLPKTSASLFLRASHILQVHRRRRGVLGGCILYKNQVLMTQLSPDLTCRLCIIRPHQKHVQCQGDATPVSRPVSRLSSTNRSEFPCQQVVTNMVLPIGVRILVVYLTHEEYKQIRPRDGEWSVPEDQVLGSGSSSNFEDDSMFVVQRQLSHRVGSKSSTGSESDSNIDLRALETEENSDNQDFEAGVDALETIHEGLKHGSSLTDLHSVQLTDGLKSRSQSYPKMPEGEIITSKKRVKEYEKDESQCRSQKAKSCHAFETLAENPTRLSPAKCEKTLMISESLTSIHDVSPRILTENVVHSDADHLTADHCSKTHVAVEHSGMNCVKEDVILANGNICGKVMNEPPSLKRDRKDCVPSRKIKNILNKSTNEEAENESMADERTPVNLNNEAPVFQNADNESSKVNECGCKPPSIIDPSRQTMDPPESGLEFVDASAATPTGSPDFNLNNFSKANDDLGTSYGAAEDDEAISRQRRGPDVHDRNDDTDSGLEPGKRRKRRRKKVVLTNPQEEVKLYIQGHSSIVLLLLIEPFIEGEDELLLTLWKTSLAHLGDLEANIKESLINEGQLLNASSAYSYLHYDRFEREVQGNTQPCAIQEIQFTDTAVQIHEEFRLWPNVRDITLKSHSNTVFGHQNPSQEVFFQSNRLLPTKTQLEASAPLMNNTMNILRKQAERTLLKNHNIKLI